MAANIFGDRFMGRREPAWHELGKVFTDPITASDAVQQAGLDYLVKTTPCRIRPFGEWITTDQVAIVRQATADDPEVRILGYAGKDYRVLNNGEIATILDPLTAEWPVETVGALGNGERVFFTLDAGDVDIKGEPVHQYFLVTEGKTGGDSLKLAYTPIRVVCQNTLITGLREATVTAAIAHNDQVKAELKFRVDLFAQMKTAMKQTNEMLTNLANRRIDGTELQLILDAAYRAPAKPSKTRLMESLAAYSAADESATIVAEATTAELTGGMATLSSVTKKWEVFSEQVKAHQTGAKSLFEKFNDEFPAIANTAWAAVQAVSECETWREGRDSVNEVVLFGHRAQTIARGFKAATALL